MEVSAYLVKPGHEREFSEGLKKYIKLAAGKADIHFTTYSMAFGSADGSEYVLLSAYKNLAEANASIAAQDALFNDMAGKDLDSLIGAIRSSVIWQHYNLFRISPKLSYPSPEMIKSEPKSGSPHQHQLKKSRN